MTSGSSEPQHLPCRGCTRACSNYSSCGGKPWRQSNLVLDASSKRRDSSSHRGEPLS